MAPFIIMALLVFVVAWVVLAFGIFADGGILFRTFRDRYPEEAKLKMKHPFESTRDPSRLFYFMTSDAKRFLKEKEDTELAILRDRVVRRVWTFVCVHFGAMVFIFSVAMIGRLLK